MAILVRLDEQLHERHMTLTELSERVDITLANLSILKTGKAKAIRFSTLEAICSVLNCQPGDLLVFDSKQPTQV
jgi:putative transcriptional regulator